MAVVGALADLMDTDPVELEPLYSTLDPDALDKLFCDPTGSTDASELSFIHEGHAITVFSSGVISISRNEDTNSVEP